MPTYISGIAASSAIDSSGESIDIAGLDISSLVGAVLNWEHKSDHTSDYVGKILVAKRIMSKEDCSNENELKYWNKCRLPLLYCLGVLFDDYSEASRQVAAIFKFDADHPGLPPTLGFSIEGSKINKEGHIITHSIARKLTLTAQPANKTCLADKVNLDDTSDQPTNSNSDPLSFLFKSVEIELFKSEEPLEKAMPMNSPAPKPAAPASPAPQDKPAAAPFGSTKAPKVAKPGLKQAPANEGVSIGQTNSGQHVMSHAKVHNYPTFNAEDHRNAAILHGQSAEKANLSSNPKMAFHHNQKMQLHNQAAASLERRANRFGNAVKQHSNKMENRDLANVVKKTEEMEKSGDKLGQPLFDKIPGKDMSPGYKAGMGTSRMGGKIRHPEIPHAFSAKETAQKELKRIKDAPKPNLPKSEEMDKALEAGSGLASPGQLNQGAALTASEKTKKKKSKWLARAEEAYDSWGKKEEFRNFMSKRLPHLTKAEIDVMGRTMLLKKTLEAEKALGDLVKSKK